MVRVANCWSAVQAYYVLYGATQALLVSEGKQRPTNHTSTQRQFVDLWTSRPSKSMAPWSFALAVNSEREADADGFLRGPGRPIDAQVHPWQNWTPTQAWDVAAQALRSTRRSKVKEIISTKRREKTEQRKKAWCAEENDRIVAGKSARKVPTFPVAQLTVSEKENADKAVRPITIAHYLYRLRVKANYEEASDFLTGPASDSEAQLLSNDLVRLSSATMLVHEVRVASNIGKRTLIRAIDEWLTPHSDVPSKLGLRLRRELHDDI